MVERAEGSRLGLSTFKVVARVLEGKTSASERQQLQRDDKELEPRVKSRCEVTLSLPFKFITYSKEELIGNKEIGRGGYSRCYRMRAINGQHCYAVKVIPRANLGSRKARKRVETEVKIHSRLNHPGIVTFYESHVSAAHCFLLIEYCPNGTLNEWLKKRKRFNEEGAYSLLSSIFDAVRYLHDKLIFHGDLKLTNILLDAAMRPKLCDFGFAKQLTYYHQKWHHPYGTPSYMAREIIVSPQEFGLEADIWSLGVIMYTLLHGKTPFDAKFTHEVYARIAQVDLQFPPLVPPLSVAAKAMIVRMLNPNPEYRPVASQLSSEPWPRKYSKPTPAKSHFSYAQERLKNVFSNRFRHQKKPSGHVMASSQ